MIWAYPDRGGKVYGGDYVHGALAGKRLHLPTMELDNSALELRLARLFGVDIGYGTVCTLPRRLALSSEATAAACLLVDGLPRSSTTGEVYMRPRRDLPTSRRAAQIERARHDINAFVEYVIADERHHLR